MIIYDDAKERGLFDAKSWGEEFVVGENNIYFVYFYFYIIFKFEESKILPMLWWKLKVLFN